MKISNLKYWIFTVLLVGAMAACSDDDDFSDSILDTTPEPLTETDVWIMDNFTKSHNIDVIYKWRDFETNQELNLVPPTEDRVIPFLDVVRRVWMDPYIKLGGISFFNKTAPKQLMLVGSAGYLEDGLYLLGEAEQGNRITVYSINNSNPYEKDMLLRNTNTFHHEYVHILHQLEKYPPAFEEISAKDYTTNWSGIADPYQLGFVSNYAAADANEDFAETVAKFIMMEEKEWNGMLMYPDSEEAKKKLKEKETIMLQYMKNVWGIDMYQLRKLVQAEVAKILEEGKQNNEQEQSNDK